MGPGPRALGAGSRGEMLWAGAGPRGEMFRAGAGPRGEMSGRAGGRAGRRVQSRSGTNQDELNLGRFWSARSRWHTLGVWCSTLWLGVQCLAASDSFILSARRVHFLQIYTVSCERLILLPTRLISCVGFVLFTTCQTGSPRLRRLGPSVHGGPVTGAAGGAGV